MLFRSNYRADNSYLYTTTPSRDPIANPDAAAYGDNYSATIVNAPTNAPTVATSNPGDIAGGGYGSGNNQSDTGTFIDNSVAAGPSTVAVPLPPSNPAVISANSPTSSDNAYNYTSGTATQNASNPVDIAGGGFGSGSSGGTSSAITGSTSAPGTGGQSGAQATPSGSSQTGAGAASC